MDPPRRLERRRTKTTATTRVAVTPPDLWRREPLLKSLAAWLWPDKADHGARALDAAREDFVLALSDVRAEDAADLLTRSRHARSLRELWHLRAELYSILAQRHSQDTAEDRLRNINRHFPQRVRRDSTVELD